MAGISQPIGCTLPAYNAEAFVEEAIDSILGQTRPPSELVLVDDGSTDRTVERARRAGGRLLRVVSQPNSGIAAARNRGIAELTSPLIALSDADDISLPERFAALAEALSGDPEAGGAYCHWRNEAIGDLADAEMPDRLHLGRPQTTLLTGTMLFRRSGLDAIGPFDTSFRAYAETAWHIRAKDVGQRFVEVPSVLYIRRIHASNNSRGKTVEAAPLIEFLHARFKRQHPSG